MVSSTASVPVWVFFTDGVDVIGDNTDQSITIVGGDGQVDVLNDVGNTYGQEEHMGLIGMMGHERALTAVHFIDEVALDGVDVLCGPIVDQWLFSFLIGPHFESLHHLNMTPNGQPTTLKNIISLTKSLNFSLFGAFKKIKNKTVSY